MNEPFDAEDLEVPALGDALAGRVLALAHAGQAPALTVAAALPARLRQAVVPLLLLSAGGCRTALTIEEIPKAFAAPRK